nr:MAG TPA: hypothetical protein [Caudoviricetes sp.]
MVLIHVAIQFVFKAIGTRNRVRRLNYHEFN